ncbi:MAG: bile acid:sodium symporter family protein [Pseudomonadota bacterium]
MNVTPNLLLGALALVMFGLGLALSVDDFLRVARYRVAVALALGLQVIVLPIACLAIVLLFGLSPEYAVGMLILAASPGGITANLFSHLFGGRVAVNITLTAINTLLAIVSLPLIANLSIGFFIPPGPDATVVPLQFGKVVQVVGVVVIPVASGMFVARIAPNVAARSEKPFKALATLVLASFAILAIVQEREALITSLTTLGPAVVVFNLLSLLSGYYLARSRGLDEGTARAISFEIGIHNSTLALYIALSVLMSFEIALPAALYSISMYITAALFGTWLGRARYLQKPAQ